MASVELFQESLGDARQHIERALVIYEREIGPRSYSTASLTNNLGGIAWFLGDLETARRQYERAVAIWEAVLGPESAQTAIVVGNQGNVALASGKLEEALALYARSLAVLERARPDHHATALARTQLGSVLVATGRLDEAQSQLYRALPAQEAGLGPENADAAGTWRGLADLYLARSNAAAAVALAERALLLYEKVGSAEPVDLLRARVTLGLANLASRNRTEAVRVLEVAVAALDERAFPFEAARAEFALARALGDAGGERALALAMQARGRFSDAGSLHDVAKVDRWLTAAGGRGARP
jgi:tetratricopeptide (TPR) repeat protein